MKGKHIAIVLGGLAIGAVAIGGGYTFLMGKGGGKRVLFIDSYHAGYAWSDGITVGVKEVFADSGVELRVHRMDTKRNNSEDFKKQAALEAKAAIEAFKPDVVIAADDNAQKYLIVPYYRGGDLPVVFAGVNWDASPYGYPASNVTGMVEVSRPDELVNILRTLSGGVSIGSLTGDTTTSRKEHAYYADQMNFNFDKSSYVKTFDQWKQEFVRLQDEVDMLFMYNNAGIEGWDDDEAARFVRQNARIPSGSVQPWMAPYVLIAYTKNAQEQGEWAAQAALQILNGASPSAIPMATNKRGNMIINSQLAQRLQMEIPASLLNSADDVL
ncbi:MAG: ABC transporter substrate-binding protein [Kiloniellales bacterium]|nr:ABC transporter substrate-binding protein [Kiloniellales bacterium]